MIKICNIHGQQKFTKKGKNSYQCVKCASEISWRRRRMIKSKAVEYKGGKCEKCGYNKCVQALTFHHIDPSQKEFDFGGTIPSWERTKVELDKCMLLCHNCHAEEHYKIFHEKDPELDKRLSTYKPKEKLDKKYCANCGGEISKKSTYCRDCYSSHCSNRIVWPSDNDLAEMVENSSVCAVGRKLKLSESTIRSHLVRRGLPTKSTRPLGFVPNV